MSEKGSLFYGIDDETKKAIYIDNVDKGKVYRCPDCNCPLIARRGEKNIHHFAHHSKFDRSECAFQYYDATELAQTIEKKFADKGYQVEVRYDLPDGKKIIANAVIGNNVVLIRDNNKLNENKVQSEVEFFNSKGMNAIYYVNLKNEVSRNGIKVSEREEGKYIKVKWSNGSHRFLQGYSTFAHRHIFFFDMSDTFNEKVVPLSHYKIDESRYIFNEKYDFNVDGFVDYCINKDNIDSKLGGITVDLRSGYKEISSYRDYYRTNNEDRPDYSNLSGDPTGCDYYNPAPEEPSESLYNSQTFEIESVPKVAIPVISAAEQETTNKDVWHTIEDLCSSDDKGVVIIDTTTIGKDKVHKYWINVENGKPETKNGHVVGRRTWKYNGTFQYGDQWVFHDENKRKWKLEYAKKKDSGKEAPKEQSKYYEVPFTIIENFELEEKQEEVLPDTRLAEEIQAEESHKIAKTLTQIAFDYLTEGKTTFYVRYIQFNNRRMLYEDNKIYELKLDGSKGREVPS